MSVFMLVLQAVNGSRCLDQRARELVALATHSKAIPHVEAAAGAAAGPAPGAAIASFIRWRNARARPKTGFAIASPIRTGTHRPAKAA